MNTKIVLISLLFCASIAHANVAVSEINGKFDVTYGNIDSSDGLITEGSISLPVTDPFGFQFDALYADIEDVGFDGFGGHLFWRDPELALLGVAIGGIWGDDIDSYEFSLEGEYYYGLLTFGARLGYASIDYEDRVPFIDTDEDGAFGLVYASAYPMEELSVLVGLETRFDNSSIRLDVEYKLPVCGFSVFAQGMVASNDYDHALFGLRYYFGSEKTLKERHRQDDPRNIVKDILFGITTYNAEFNRRSDRYDSFDEAVF